MNNNSVYIYNISLLQISSRNKIFVLELETRDNIKIKYTCKEVTKVYTNNNMVL